MPREDWIIFFTHRDCIETIAVQSIYTENLRVKFPWDSDENSEMEIEYENVTARLLIHSVEINGR